MIEVNHYLDSKGRDIFARWSGNLDREAAGRIERALLRLTYGNTSSVKAVGGGVNELKIDFGPGYRVYFGWQGDTLVILLGGGTKKRQQQDIRQAQERWSDFKSRL